MRILKYAVALLLLWCIPAVLFGMQWLMDALETGKWANVQSGILRSLPRWLVWAPLTPVAVWISRRIEQRAKLNVRLRIPMHLLAAAVLALLAAMGWAAGPMGGTSNYSFGMWLLVYYPVSLVWSVPLYGGIAAITYALDERLARQTAERALTEARLEALHAQLRPHFFFNTLHSIASLIRAGRGNDAVSMIARLGDLMRETLNDGGVRTTLARELDMVRLYLEIQKVRFSDRLEVRFVSDPRAMAVEIPALLLQPLVENAVDHGIAPLAEGGTIFIESRLTGSHLELEVRNSGSLRPAFSEGIGLGNTRQRLAQIYGLGHSFEMRDVAGFVSVRIGIDL